MLKLAKKLPRRIHDISNAEFERQLQADKEAVWADLKKEPRYRRAYGNDDSTDITK